MEPDLRMIIARLSRRMRTERPHTELSDSQVSVLITLRKHGAQTIGELSTIERVTAPSMNRTVNLLEASGLVTRESSPDDGRKVIVDISDVGNDLITEIKQHRQAWFERRLAVLDDDERAALDAAAPVLRKLAEWEESE